jgi:hypothetical protein
MTRGDHPGLLAANEVTPNPGHRNPSTYRPGNLDDETATLAASAINVDHSARLNTTTALSRSVELRTNAGRVIALHGIRH